jgi:hypothetical protein
VTSSENSADAEINWRSEYFRLFTDYDVLMNKFVNQSRKINDLLQIIAQHEEINKEKDQA